MTIEEFCHMARNRGYGAIYNPANRLVTLDPGRLDQRTVAEKEIIKTDAAGFWDLVRPLT